MEHAPVQDTQPPDLLYPTVLLHHPVPEFWTPMLKSQGWSPLQKDKFIHIAACATDERAYEWHDPKTNKIYGRLTSALVEVIDELSPEGKRISYNTLEWYGICLFFFSLSCNVFRFFLFSSAQFRFTYIVALNRGLFLTLKKKESLIYGNTINQGSFFFSRSETFLNSYQSGSGKH